MVPNIKNCGSDEGEKTILRRFCCLLLLEIFLTEALVVTVKSPSAPRSLQSSTSLRGRPESMPDGTHCALLTCYNQISMLPRASMFSQRAQTPCFRAIIVYLRSIWLAREVAESLLWVFGYGSLVWKPPEGFTPVDSVPGAIRGYTRKFWQGSTDHRGVPGAPGLVATLLRNSDIPKVVQQITLIFIPSSGNFALATHFSVRLSHYGPSRDVGVYRGR